MNLCHIKSLINVIHIDLLYINSYELLLHRITTNINRDFFLDYYPPFGVRMCESRSHVYILWDGNVVHMGVFSGRQFFFRTQKVTK